MERRTELQKQLEKTIEYNSKLEPFRDFLKPNFFKRMESGKLCLQTDILFFVLEEEGVMCIDDDDGGESGVVSVIHL